MPISPLDVYRAILAEPDPKTPQVSTDDLRRILADGSAIVLDSRKRAEYVAGHIAGARNVAPVTWRAAGRLCRSRRTAGRG